MTKAIIAIPAALSHHELTSLRELLTGSNPELNYEFQQDYSLSRPDVMAFEAGERTLEENPADEFTYMSTLQSALYKFDAMLRSRPSH